MEWQRDEVTEKEAFFNAQQTISDAQKHTEKAVCRGCDCEALPHDSFSTVNLSS